MELLRQKNNWSCLPTSFAMACRVSIEDFIDLIGHDGSELLWPKLCLKYRRRSFHIQECLHAAYFLGYSFTQFDFKISQTPNGTDIFCQDQTELVTELMQNNSGVVLGRGLISRHAVAWDGTKYYDPTRGLLDFENQYFTPESILLRAQV